MFLMLHVTCSYIFHAYVPLFSIFFILIVFDAFLLLSLSLSFYSVSLRLAPKPKSTPSRNPLHFETCSSSSPVDSIPSHVGLCDEKAHKDFSENFSQRNIHSECQVILLDFSDTDLHTVIYSKGWESLYGIPVTFPSVIIQEFYSNMHGFDYFVPHFFTRIQGTCIVVTLNLISKVLHILRVAHPNYPCSDLLRTMSKDKLSSLFCETPSS